MPFAASPSLNPSPLRRAFPWLLAGFSGLFLWSAYPPWNEAESAWFALAPLIGLARYSSPRRAFQLGLLSGIAFWFPSLAWLWKLTENGGPWALVVIGHLALSFYCALYTAVFGTLVSILWSRWRPEPSSIHPGVWGDLARALLAALLWAGLEMLRSTVLTGFAWNHLGVSQISNRSLIQSASLGGVYAVSALVLFLNATLANVAIRVWRGISGLPAPRRHWDLMVTLGSVVVAFLWGGRQIRHWEALNAGGPFLTVATVQPNAPSIFDRDDNSMQAALERLADRTLRVAAFRPDLIVWPETVLFGSVPQDQDTMDFAFTMARRASAPILAGAVEIERVPGEKRPLVANVSWLFQPDGVVSGRYRKQHLVPFGEFIPMDRWFPWLERLSPIGYSCTPGTESVLMSVPLRGGLASSADDSPQAENAPAPAILSPLICFEDTVAPLARKAVLRGATVLVNQSNDAWFAGSSEAEQHHAQAVFRAIENRISLVRCSNAGRSGVVDPTGRSSEPADFLVMPVTPRQPDWPLSPYTRRGDRLFGWPCAGLVVLVALWGRRNR